MSEAWSPVMHQADIVFGQQHFVLHRVNTSGSWRRTHGEFGRGEAGHGDIAGDRAGAAGTAVSSSAHSTCDWAPVVPQDRRAQGPCHRA